MTVNNLVDKIISPLIKSQFPQFYQTEGESFVAFITAYFEWMESHDGIGSVITESRSIVDYIDVDYTVDKFIKHFKDTYLSDFPESLAVDKKFIIKHILDFYRTKGTERGYKLLFRILYNEDVKINFPGKYMWRLSNGIWKIPKYIETTDSPYLKQLINKQIRGTSGGIAVVESYNQKVVKGKTINILYISALTDDFLFGDFLFCDEFLDMTLNPPMVIGSLSSIPVGSGGINFKVGDELQIYGTGSGGLAQVAATKFENGKVTFNLLNGGEGFSSNAIITVDNTGTGGSGASFKIGGIINQQVIQLNTDKIDIANDILLDTSTFGYQVDTTLSSDLWVNGEGVLGQVYTRHLNVDAVFRSDFQISNGETVGNTTLDISGLTIYFADDYNDLYLTGTENDLNNANLVPGVLLVSNISGVVVKVNYPSATELTYANGLVIFSGSNSTSVAVHRDSPDVEIGYYVPGMTITGNVSGATATVINTTRLTDWQVFPATAGPSNLDSIIGDTFAIITKQIGKISYIESQNPGDGYVTAPSVTIIEPLVHELKIKDTLGGGYWGGDASIIATAGSANGIVTALRIIDSGFGYTPDEYVVCFNDQNPTAVYGKAVVSTSGAGKGYWKDTQSFLSDMMVLQDSDYYQVYSYEIVCEKMLGAYDKFVKDLIHPVGYKLFGRYAVHRELGENCQIAESFYRRDFYNLLSSDGEHLLAEDGSEILFDLKEYLVSTDHSILISFEGSPLVSLV